MDFYLYSCLGSCIWGADASKQPQGFLRDKLVIPLLEFSSYQLRL